MRSGPIMADHVAFAVPHHLVYAERSSPIQLSGNGVRQLDNGYRAVSSTSLDTPSETYQMHNTVNQIIQHPKFDTWFPSIKSCLQLNNQTWAAFLKLREDIEAKSKLEIFHSSIWRVPPDEIWTNVVHLRQEPTFCDLQLKVLAEVEDAYHQAHQSTSTYHFHNTKNDELTRASCRASSTIPHVNSGTSFCATDSSGNPRDGQIQVGQKNVPLASSSSSKPTAAIPSSGISKHRTKQAPSGMCYHCPSQGCSKTFIRLAHYHNHLNKNHPDFGPQHPNHSPWMALRRKPPNVRHNSRSSNTLRFGEQLQSAPYQEGSGSRALSASRRGSQVSLSSLNSGAVSSSAADEAIEDSFLGMMEMPSFDTLVPDESSVWHMGGATMMTHMGGMMNNGYYTGLANDGAAGRRN